MDYWKAFWGSIALGSLKLDCTVVFEVHGFINDGVNVVFWASN